MIDWLASVFAPWQSIYSESTAVSTTILAIHLASLLISGGFAVGADRATLLALRLAPDQRQAHVEELHALHRPVLVALLLLFVSGVLMLAADVKVYAASVVFWTKMVLIALLLANGSRLYSTGARILSHTNRAADATLWTRLGSSARVSFTLWLVITVLGAVLTSVG